MPQHNSCKDSYLCPITQAGPYFVAKAFPDTRFLSPVLDFTNGYAASTAMTEMAVRRVGSRPRTGRRGLGGSRAQPDGSRVCSDGTGAEGSRSSTGGRQAGNLIGGPQLQRLYAGGFAIGGQETFQHGSAGDSRGLPCARRSRTHGLAFRKPDLERGLPRKAAPQSFPSQREQLQLHDRCIHPFFARVRAGIETISDPRNRRPHCRRWRANTAGSFPRYRAKLPRRADQLSPIFHSLPAGQRRQCHLFKWRASAPYRPAGKTLFLNFSQYHAESMAMAAGWLGPARWRSGSHGSEPTRPGSAVHFRPRVSSAASLHRATSQNPSESPTRRDRGFLSWSAVALLA